MHHNSSKYLRSGVLQWNANEPRNLAKLLLAFCLAQTLGYQDCVEVAANSSPKATKFHLRNASLAAAACLVGPKCLCYVNLLDCYLKPS